MKSLFEGISTRLQSFIEQRDDVALVVRCPEAESIVVLKTLEGLDEASASEFFWIFQNEFTSPEAYVTALTEEFKTKQEAVRLAMEAEGMEPWPALPAKLSDESIPPANRLRDLMAFARSLIPGEDGILVWVLFPSAIQDGPAYGRLVWELLRHEYPFPWCHRMRLFVRDDDSNPILAETFDQREHIDWYEPDLSPDAVEEALEEQAADEDQPMDERIQSVMIMATTDYSNRRYDTALERYQLILPYFAKTDDGPMAAMTMNAMGECHRELGDLEQAERCFESALEPASEHDPPSVPVLLNAYLNLANLTFAQERWIEAEAYFDGAQQMALVQLEQRTHIESLERMGHAQYMQGKADEAVESWKTGARVAHKVGEQDLEERILELLRQCYDSTGESEGLADFMRELEELDESGPSEN